MDDEIDLWPYVRGLLRRWPLILGLAVLAAALSTAISLLQPNVYEAVALVTVSTPRYNLQPDGTSINAPLPVRGYPELAQSGDVITQVWTTAQSQSLLPNIKWAAFQGELVAEAASDPTLVRLKVRDSDPHRAATLANIWADVFVARAGVLYLQDQADLKIFTSQLSDAKAALDKAQSDLAAFQAANQVSILTAQLNSQQSTLTDDLNRQHDLTQLTQDVHDLISRLGALPGSTASSPAEDLALLAITGRIYGTSNAAGASNSGSSLPVVVQLTAGQPLAGPTVADQLALANNLRDTIAARLADISGKAAAIQPQILALQGQVAAAQLKENDLVRVRDLADSDYRKLVGQVQDATLVAQASSNTIQVASRALVPAVRVGPHRTTNILLGTAVGLVIGLVTSLVLDYRRSAGAQPPPASTGQSGGFV